MSTPVEQSRLTRRTIIEMARRRQRPGTGSGPDFLAERTTHMQWPDMTPLLEPIRWAVIDVVATRLYMPERMTQDFDIAIAVANAEQTRRRLATAGLVKLGDLSIGGSQWQTPDGMRIDVIEGYDPWWPEALAEAQANRDAQGLPILPLPYLVLMKFNASRTIDLGDISRMLGLAGAVDIDRVRSVFQRYAPDDLEDLESLISLGRMETGRFDE